MDTLILCCSGLCLASLLFNGSLAVFKVYFHFRGKDE